MVTGVVIKPSAWIYGEGRKEHIDEIFMGWAVGILKDCGGWMEVVTHYGYRGFLKKEEVCICTPEELQGRDESGRTIVISRAFADVMEGPNVHSQILCTLSRGSFLTSLHKVQNGYRKVRLADGREGYVPSISFAYRKENDGYLYYHMPDTYFLNWKNNELHLDLQLRKQLVSHAKSYLGTQYRWGGKSAEGIDCSGLIFMCYLMNGVIIYRDAKIKKGYPVHEISLEKIKPGDLLYFPGHIAMYLGNQKYIHATGNKNSFGCVINSLSKKDADYREDLAESLLKAGSIW